MAISIETTGFGNNFTTSSLVTSSAITWSPGDFVVIALVVWNNSTVTLTPNTALNSTNQPNLTLINTYQNGDCECWVYYIPDANANSSAIVGFTSSSSVAAAVLGVVAYTGWSSSQTLDGTPVSNTFTSVTPTGGTYTPTVSGDLLIGLLFQGMSITNGTAPSYSSPSSGFTNRLSGGVARTSSNPHLVCGLAILDNLSGGTSAVTPSCTSSESGTGVGITLGVKGPSSTPSLIPLTPPLTSYHQIWNFYRGDPAWDYLDRPAS